MELNIMPIHERRQHFRIDDHLYFDYRILEPGTCFSEKAMVDGLLDQSSEHYLEVTNYFQNIDQELTQLTQNLAQEQPMLAHYLNLINAKVDCLTKHLLLGSKIQLRKVTLSLGSMSFKSKDRIKEGSHLKMVIYTKPKLIPIIIDAKVISSKFLSDLHYKSVVAFENLTVEQEQLLSQHIMLTQLNCQAY